MKFALVIEDTVRELFDSRPDLHESLEIVEVPDTVAVGFVRQPEGGAFVAPVPFERTWLGVKGAAAVALRKSDRVVLRCYEAGVPVPDTWKSYRAALRAIAGQDNGDPTTPLPAAPPFPAGT